MLLKSCLLGNETISHIYEPGNGRITIMFQAFEGPPRIVRLYGKGTEVTTLVLWLFELTVIFLSGKVFELGSPEFNALLDPSADPGEYDSPTPELLPGARAIIWVDIDLVGTSCGFSVPFMEFISHRKYGSTALSGPS